MSSLFPKAGSPGTPDNPKVITPGNVRLNKVEYKPIKKAESKANIADKFLNSTLKNRQVIRPDNATVDLRRLGF